MSRVSIEEQRRKALEACPDLLRRLEKYEGGGTPEWVLEARREIAAEVLLEWLGSKESPP